MHILLMFYHQTIANKQLELLHILYSVTKYTLLCSLNETNCCLGISRKVNAFVRLYYFCGTVFTHSVSYVVICVYIQFIFTRFFHLFKWQKLTIYSGLQLVKFKS